MNDSEKSLKERIAAAKARHDDDPTNDPGYDPNAESNSSAMGQAMRVGIELVAAVGVGTFMGYWLDQWLGTAPFGMIILFFLGFAAGFLNIWRAQSGTYHQTGTAGWVDPPEATSKTPSNDPAQGLTTPSKDGQKEPDKNQND